MTYGWNSFWRVLLTCVVYQSSPFDFIFVQMSRETQNNSDPDHGLGSLYHDQSVGQSPDQSQEQSYHHDHRHTKLLCRKLHIIYFTISSTSFLKVHFRKQICCIVQLNTELTMFLAASPAGSRTSCDFLLFQCSWGLKLCLSVHSLSKNIQIYHWLQFVSLQIMFWFMAQNAIIFYTCIGHSEGS